MTQSASQKKAPRPKRNHSITDTFVKEVKRPTRQQRATWYWDRKLTGFGLKVYYTGKKVYGVRFILKGGKSRWCAIGEDGNPWNAGTARSKAKQMLQNVLDGLAPDHAKVEKEEVFASLADLYGDYTDHLDNMVAKGAMSERTVKKYKRQWEQNLRASDKSALVSSLSMEFFDALHTWITDNPIKKGLKKRPIEANRTLDMLSAMLAWVMERPLKQRRGLTENWVAKVTQNVENDERGVWLSEEDQTILFDFLLDPANRYQNWYEQEQAARRLARRKKTRRPERRRPRHVLTETMADALLVLFTTGLRSKEVMCLRWDEVDGNRQTATLQQNKQGPGPTERIQHKRIFLPAEVMEILAKRPREGPWVFPSNGRGLRSGSGHIVNLQDCWERVRKHLNLPNIRLHDFRHTVACELASHPNGTVKNIQQAMGWATAQTALRYLHARQKALDAMVQETASTRFERARKI